MTQMNRGPYGVKGLKSWRGRDGVGYQYHLTENGKKVAFINQDGCGGEVDIDFDDPADLARFNAFIKDLPEQQCEFSGKMEPVSGPMFLAQLADDHEQQQYLKRHCRTKTLVVLNSYNEGQYLEYKKAYSPAFKAWLQEKHGTDLIEIINERFMA